jgi:uncharacterized membrane protein YbhN (UPF0104 family)
VGFIRRNWQRFTIARRERLLRRALLSLAIALVAAILVYVLVWALIIFGFELSGCTAPCDIASLYVSVAVSGVLLVIAAVVAILGSVRGFVLLVLAFTSALQRRKKHPSRLT